jgi:hypothetical protein
VVTGTFKHSSAKVIDLYVEGLVEPIGTTANHLFWSEDRAQFVRADELSLGERLRTVQGRPAVARVSPREERIVVYNLEVAGSHTYHVTQAGVLVHNATPRTGYIYEITYVEDGTKRVYVGQAGSGAQDVYERLWGSRAGITSQGNKGRDILRAHPDAELRIWQVDLSDTPAGRGFLGTQEQLTKEEVARAQGASVLDNVEEARSTELGSAFKNSGKQSLPEAEQEQIREEIRRLLAEGKTLPDSTPANRAIKDMSKYDLDTLRYGDRRKLVLEGQQEVVKARARLLCGR